MTQADIDAGLITNVASASGTVGGAGVTSNSDTATVRAIGLAAIALEKTGVYEDADADGVQDAGDRIRYSFTVTNTGNVTLSDVRVTDPLVTVSGGPLASLAPGASDATTFSAVYTLTQADIDAGSVEQHGDRDRHLRGHRVHRRRQRRPATSPRPRPSPSRRPASTRTPTPTASRTPATASATASR